MLGEQPFDGVYRYVTLQQLTLGALAAEQAVPQPVKAGKVGEEADVFAVMAMQQVMRASGSLSASLVWPGWPAEPPALGAKCCLSDYVVLNF
jgi:hypothetical protein